jgi:hypothetical protein
MKVRLVGAEFFHTDGRREMSKLIVAFRSFANAPKNLTDIASLFTVNVAGMLDMSKQAHSEHRKARHYLGNPSRGRLGNIKTCVPLI